MSRRGLSDIVTMILIVLTAMAAIVLIWNFVQPLIGKASGLDASAYTTKLSVSPDSISLDPNTNLLSLNINRDAGDGDLSGFIFGLQDPEGNVKTFRQNITLSEFENKKFQINYSEFLIDDVLSVTITPIFRQNGTNKETLGIPIQQPVKNKTKFNLPSGLVSHWKMDGNWVDSINSLSGAAVGTATFSSTNKKIGSAAADFNGLSGSYMQVSDNVLLNPSQFTIVAWVNPRNLTLNAFNNILDKSSLSTGYSLGFDRVSSTWQFKTRGTGTPTLNTVSLSGSNALNTWEFVAASFDPSNSRIYYNSISNQTQNSATLNPSTTTLKVGSSFNSTIDEVMLFNRVLTSQEVSDIRTKYR